MLANIICALASHLIMKMGGKRLGLALLFGC